MFSFYKQTSKLHPWTHEYVTYVIMWYITHNYYYHILFLARNNPGEGTDDDGE